MWEKPSWGLNLLRQHPWSCTKNMNHPANWWHHWLNQTWLSKEWRSLMSFSGNNLILSSKYFLGKHKADKFSTLMALQGWEPLIDVCWVPRYWGRLSCFGITPTLADLIIASHQFNWWQLIHSIHTIREHFSILIKTYFTCFGYCHTNALRYKFRRFRPLENTDRWKRQRDKTLQSTTYFKYKTMANGNCSITFF